MYLPGGKPMKRGKALFAVSVGWDYAAERSDELNIKEGEVLDIVEISTHQGWWKARNRKGDIGLVPDNFVKLLSTG